MTTFIIVTVSLAFIGVLAGCLVFRNKNQTKEDVKKEYSEDELMYMKARSRARRNLMEEEYYSGPFLGRGHRVCYDDFYSRLDDETDRELWSLYAEKYK